LDKGASHSDTVCADRLLKATRVDNAKPCATSKERGSFFKQLLPPMHLPGVCCTLERPPQPPPRPEPSAGESLLSSHTYSCLYFKASCV
jgi:hypothetical protein